MADNKAPEQQIAKTDTQVSRVEVAQKSDGSSYSRVIEVPVQKETGFGFAEAVSAVSAGSWAIVVLFGVLWWKFAPSVAKFLEAYMVLIKAMKESLEANATSIKDLADSEKVQSITISSLQSTDKQILEVVQQLTKDIPNMQKRLKISVELLEELRELHQVSNNSLNEIAEEKMMRTMRAKLLRHVEDDE